MSEEKKVTKQTADERQRIINEKNAAAKAGGKGGDKGGDKGSGKK